MAKRTAVSEARSWDEIGHDILVYIFKFLRFEVKRLRVCYVCKQWLLAALESEFTGGDVLDLRRMDTFRRTGFYKGYFRLLELRFERCGSDLWSKLYLPGTCFEFKAYQYIAER